MRRLSSKWTFFYKRVFPVIALGFIAIFVGVNLYASPHSQPFANVPVLVVPIIMVGIVFFFLRKLVFDLVDEVWDDGNALVVKNGGQEERIALTDIKNVNYQSMMNPPRVSLSLRRPTAFGDKIAFCAPVRFVPFTTSPVIDDLIERIDAARQKQG